MPKALKKTRPAPPNPNSILADAKRKLDNLELELFDYFEATSNDWPYRHFGELCQRMATLVLINRADYREAAEAAYREADRCVERSLSRQERGVA